MEQAPFHKAAGSGDLPAVLAFLDGPEPPAPNAPDESGLSAIFYAQLRGHHEVVKELTARGWTPMPEGNVFIGPGGRNCYWNAPHGDGRCRPRAQQDAQAERCRSWFAEAPMSSADAVAGGDVLQVRVSSRPSNCARPNMHKMAVRARQAERAHWPRDPGAAPRSHALYARKQAGVAGGGGAGKPRLNTRDAAEAYALPRDQAAAAALAAACAPFEDDDDADEGEEAGAEAVEAARAAPPSLGEVLRFVVARKPSRSADGSWVLVHHDEMVEEAVVAEEGDEQRRALGGGARAEEVWPALRRACSGEGSAPDEAGAERDGEWLLVLDEEEAAGEEAAAAGGAAGGGCAWQGAAATRAAVGLGESDKSVATAADGQVLAAFAPLPGRAAGEAAGVGEPARPAAAPAAASGEGISDGEWSPGFVGAKDDSHRVRGSKGRSIRLLMRRDRSMARREAQRHAT